MSAATLLDVEPASLTELISSTGHLDNAGQTASGGQATAPQTASAARTAGARQAASAGQPASTGHFLVRTAPCREPPFDDEPAARHLSLVGPLDQPLPFELLDLRRPSALRLSAEADQFAVQPTGRLQLPEPAAFARRLVIGVIETATGRRSASQLRQHTSPAVQAGLLRDAGRISRLGTAQRPATLHSLHFCEPADGVAEVAAVLRVGDRFRALALRLEGLDGRWRCMRLQIG